MPDPGGDLPPSQKQPSAKHLDGPTALPVHLMPAPRSHPQNLHHPKESSKPVSAPPPPPGFSEALEWMQRYGNMEVSTSPPHELPRSRRSSYSQLSKEQRKFHKFDPEHPQARATVSGEAEPSQLRGVSSENYVDEPPIQTDYPRGITSDQIAFIRRLRQEAPERSPWFAVGVAVLVFFLVITAFIFGHSTLPKLFAGSRLPALSPQKSANVGMETGKLTVSVLELIDEAMAAETAKDYAKAVELLDNAQRDAGHLDGLDYRLAYLHYEAGDATRALPLLNHSIAEAEEVAACLSLRGMLANQPSGSTQGMADLEKATQLDPFEARYFFVWGEALRRVGKPQLALGQLRRAADRLREPALQPMYSLKIRLTQLELGEEELFTQEMAKQLQLGPPSADWLLTAAAVEMHHGNFSTAAELLAKVCGLIGEHETTMQLRDVYFTNFAREKLLAKYFEEPAASAALPVTPTP